MGVIKPRRWTKEEDKYLKDVYNKGFKVVDIAFKLGRTKSSITSRVPLLGLTRPEKTHEMFLKEINELVGSEYKVASDYIGSHTNVSMEHVKCGYIFKVTPANFISGRSRCRSCSSKRLSKLYKKTNEQFVKEIKDLTGKEFILKEEYKGNQVPIKFNHVICGEEYKMSPSAFLRGQRCPTCSRKKGDKKRSLTHERFVNKVEEVHGKDYEVLGEYIKSHKHVEVKHKTCGNVYKSLPASLVNGKGCTPCGVVKSGLSRRATNEEYLDIVEKETNGEYCAMEDYKGSKTPVMVKHNKCGHAYPVQPNAFMQGRRCPKCNGSKGEAITSNYLQNNYYNFVTEYHIKDCKDKRSLPFDFAILNNGELVCLIEYEGKQHYEPVEFWGGEEALKGVKRRDKIKRDYCKSNDIPLIEIPYWEKENIESMLDDIIPKIYEDNEIRQEQLKMFY